MFADSLTIIIHWYLSFLVLGWLAFPIVFLMFSSFQDRGWGLARIAGLLVISYWVWIIGSLKILPFDRPVIWIGLLFLAALSLREFLKNQRIMISFLTKNWRLLMVEELFFLSLFTGWAFIRSHQPDIYGLEKFMDFGFVNAILRSDYFPPQDIWLAGETINYYYFGHLEAAVMTKLTNTPPAVGYNLMIAAILSLAFTASFSLAGSFFANLLPRLNKNKEVWLIWIAGLVSAVVCNFGGNLHTVYKIIQEGKDKYWYPDATRFIEFTIHEFPIYSYVVSDLHGHVSDIPFVLLTVAVILNLVLSGSQQGNRQSFWRLIKKTLPLGFLIGVLYMTNALDAVIYLGLFLLLMVISAVKKPIWQAVKENGITFLGVTGSAALFSLPFHLNFKPFASSLELVKQRSPVWQLLILWGLFLFGSVVFGILTWLDHKSGNKRKKLQKSYLTAMWGMIAFAFLLVAVPELVYIKDIYISEYHRANTMFKLTYQTFLMMSFLTGPIIATLGAFIIGECKKIKLGLFSLLIVFSLGIGSILIYPYFAVGSYYNKLEENRGLNGLGWLRERYPGDYAAVEWLTKNVTGQPVILEAVGDSYTEAARISANTGLPTVLGWKVHEWLWRGSFQEPALRTTEVARIYLSNDFREVCGLLDKYQVRYVVVGNLERTTYPNLTERKFSIIGHQVFDYKSTKIYAIAQPCGSGS